MNPLQKKLLQFFKEKDYAINPLLVCEPLGQDPFIVRRNVMSLVQQGFLEHKGYLTRVNRLLPLYQITDHGKKRLGSKSI
ncbi:MAG: hypothetical protein GF383_03140 [Candidatus Lokiarchaeota archaeon]|nr:hypothetical protein [Candidatus Lokiarchaeota archaeon]MBD3338558.1 hypothetical protein [Candidatus Lokiarchaeota archaeon]